MNDNRDKIALIDLDGTVADYSSAMNAQLELLRAPSEPTYDNVDRDSEPKHISARRKLIQRTPGFWRGLKPLPMGFQVINAMRVEGFNLHVLTKDRPALQKRGEKNSNGVNCIFPMQSSP